MRYLITVSYDGTDFSGYQKQPKMRTVQGEIEKALKENIFSGAYIDVTDPEPLPKDSNLWNINNLIITPHVTGGYHLEETLNRIVQISATNIKNHCEGKEIINRVKIG
mgnify:CR=1 FL=1